MAEEIKLLEKLSNAFGPSGSEEDVSKLLKGAIEKYADETHVDKLGNILFYHNGKKEFPRVMLAAHMDEIGFLVTFIEESGFLRFDTIGGITNIVCQDRGYFLEERRVMSKELLGLSRLT